MVVQWGARPEQAVLGQRRSAALTANLLTLSRRQNHRRKIGKIGKISEKISRPFARSLNS
jgi:hypothetical protein